MKTLKVLFVETGLTQVKIANALKVSGPALSRLTGEGRWPKTNGDAFRSALRAFLIERGAAESDVDEAFQQIDSGASGTAADESGSPTIYKDVPMIRKQILTREARAKFNLRRELFTDDLD